MPLLNELVIPISSKFNMVETVYSEAEVKAQHLKDLPNDAASHENASIYHLAGKIILVSDPHQLFVRWVLSTVDAE